MFKLFNRIETWEEIERCHGPLEWSTINLNAIDSTLSNLLQRGVRIYSPAYITPTPKFGAPRKHTNHLRLLARMMSDRIFDQLTKASSLECVYSLILRYPGLGPFLSFQYTIDLNYSRACEFSEEDFVVAGPGAIDGISKCFSTVGVASPEDVIYWVTEHQEQEFSNRGISFPGLFGRRLQPVDCQNLFCEVSKYARVMHPDIIGQANRRRIKQLFKLNSRAIPPPFFPPRWNLNIPDFEVAEHEVSEQRQLSLL